MPKLLKEYNKTGENKPFDKIKIRNMARDDPGLG